MKVIWLVFLCGAVFAAEPDWHAIEERALPFLQQYVRIESVNPPADTRAAAQLLKAELERNGLPVTLYTSGPNGQTNLVTRLKGRDASRKPLLLLNHFDVVPVDRKAWSMDPFGALIKDGYMWGRGTLDMKGIGVQHLMALIAMKQAGIVPARDIVMLTTADEETDGVYRVQWMMQNHWSEIESEYVLDEGGFGTRDILSPNKLVFGIMVGEKQMLWVRLRAKGTAGHGSQPIADNANLRLLKAIEKALEAPPGSKTNAVVEEMRRSLGGTLAENKFVSAIQKNTLTLTTLTAGVGSPAKANVIPSAAEATLDCRLLPGVNAEEFLSEMRARINDPRVTVEAISTPRDAGASSSETPLFAAMKRAILKQHPDAVVTPMLVPFGTDSVKLRRKGVVAYGFTPMVIDAATAASMHSDEERIPVTSFLQGIRMMFDVLRSDF